MGRRSVKENKSIYQLKREEKGLTREAASELIDGISPQRLEKLESGKTAVQPEDVLMLSRAYKEPGLCNYYCSNECAIGRKSVPEIEEKELPQIIIETVNSINKLHGAKDRLLQIAEDGAVTADEYEDFMQLKNVVDKLSVSAATLQLWFDDQAAKGNIDPEAFK